MTKAARQPYQAITARIRALSSGYEPPTFDHVPDPDAAIFLCAVDHRTGYERAHRVDGRGPFSGSELLWEAALAAARERPGLLRAAALREAGADLVVEVFRADDEIAADPDRRAALWRDLAAGLLDRYEGSAGALLAAAEGRLGGAGGLVDRLAAFEAYADPLAKKSFLFAKIAERRGWLEVADPSSWEVCADNVLMRLALRAGLVAPGPVTEVRAATRAALKELATASGLSPPVLDDLLWERGRNDPDLLGTAGGDVREPSRASGEVWY
jgi:hypothetical protein